MHSSRLPDQLVEALALAFRQRGRQAISEGGRVDRGSTKPFAIAISLKGDHPMRSSSWPLLLISTVFLLAAACTSPPTPEEAPATATPTPTATVAAELPPTATPEVVVDTGDSGPTPTLTPTATPTGAPLPSPCAGLSGELEAQIMVGPAEVVGLEPAAVGSIPFAVTTEQPPYVIQGDTDISYQDTLQKEWGTYSVSLQMHMTIDGVCTEGEDAPMLDLTVLMSGDQTVEVSAGEFQQTYPWSGENSLNLRLPLEEGATASGEGWTFVLHLD
jgi:hypothetical protein